jgi:hypothetical protein
MTRWIMFVAALLGCLAASDVLAAAGAGPPEKLIVIYVSATN